MHSPDRRFVFVANRPAPTDLNHPARGGLAQRPQLEAGLLRFVSPRSKDCS